MQENKKEKSNKGRIIAVIASLLILIYVFALFYIPKRILEYQLYYVQERLTEWPGYGGLNYALGDVILLDNHHANGTNLRKGQGWGQREDDGSWTVGGNAEILFVIKTQRDLVVTMELGAMLCESFDVFVNDNHIGNSSDIIENKLVSNISSQFYKEGELLLLKFVIKKPVRPCDISDSTDTRALGIQIKSIAINEK